MPTNLFTPLANSNNASPTGWDNLVQTWDAEVVGQYHANLAIDRIVQKKTIATGRTAKFMLTGRVGGAYHDSGEEFRGMDREQVAREYSIYDRPFYTALEEEDLIRLVEQVPAERAERTKELAYSLAKYTEIERLKQIALAASDAGPTNVQGADQFFGGYGGSDTFDGSGITGTYGNDASGAREVLAAIKNYRIGLENKNIMESQLWCVVEPALWYEIRQLDGIVAPSTSVQGTQGAAGIYNDMQINSNPIHFSQYLGMDEALPYMGVNIIRHSLFASGGDGGEGFAKDRSGDRESAGNFSTYKGLIFGSKCIGAVQKMGPTTVTERPSRTDNELVRSKVWIGGGTHQPEFACKLVTS